jgi:CBS-domain-containing membrane protein
MALTAGDIMTPRVKAVPQSWTLQQLSRFLTENEITGSPVSDEAGNIIGIATLKDIAEFHWSATGATQEERLSPEERAEARRLRQLMLREMSRHPVEVRDIMTPNTTAVSVDTDVVTVASIMMKEHLHRIFVTLDTVKDSSIVGIVTTYDMVRIVADPELAARCLEPGARCGSSDDTNGSDDINGSDDANGLDR